MAVHQPIALRPSGHLLAPETMDHPGLPDCPLIQELLGFYIAVPKAQHLANHDKSLAILCHRFQALVFFPVQAYGLLAKDGPAQLERLGNGLPVQISGKADVNGVYAPLFQPCYGFHGYAAEITCKCLGLFPVTLYNILDFHPAIHFSVGIPMGLAHFSCAPNGYPHTYLPPFVVTFPGYAQLGPMPNPSPMLPGKTLSFL